MDKIFNGINLCQFIFIFQCMLYIYDCLNSMTLDSKWLNFVLNNKKKFKISILIWFGTPSQSNYIYETAGRITRIGLQIIVKRIIEKDNLILRAILRSEWEQIESRVDIFQPGDSPPFSETKYQRINWHYVLNLWKKKEIS